MALGQGMGPKAVELIETGAQRGLWVMLQVRGRTAFAQQFNECFVPGLTPGW